MKKKSNIIWMLPITLVIVVFSVLPVVMSMSDAFVDNGGTITLDNFRRVISDDLFIKSYVNSIIYSLTSVISIGLSIYLAMTIINISNTYLRSFASSIVYLQYVFLGLAISTGYIFIFKTDYGIINDILNIFNIEKISFLENRKLSVLTISFVNIITSLPFLVTSITYRGLNYINSKEMIIKTNSISSDDWILKKSMIINMSGFILLITYFTLTQNFLSYPIGLYSGDLSAIFVAESQTLVCYINRSISIGSYENAAVCALITLFSILMITLIFVFIYWRVGDKNV